MLVKSTVKSNIWLKIHSSGTHPKYRSLTGYNILRNQRRTFTFFYPGFMFDANGSYDMGFVLMGIMISFSGLMLYPVPCLQASIQVINKFLWTHALSCTLSTSLHSGSKQVSKRNFFFKQKVMRGYLHNISEFCA